MPVNERASTADGLDGVPAARDAVTRRTMLQGIGAASAGLALAPSLGAQGAASRAGAGTAVREIRAIENVWIPMPDGVRITARIWLPVDAEQRPVPAIMEYIPYRKRDGTRVREEPRMSYWASRGYACIRPDIRGSGDSEGIQIDEYVKQEQDDGVEIIRWLARQPWCTGAVGMVGISWGGFSALQVAARHPPELKAIMTHCSTDDRYADDAHYMGGCVIQDMFIWGSMFFNHQASPPDPQIVGAERWRSMWMERLEKLECRVADWMRHPHRDAFWKHGSVAENYDDIRCPVYAIGGWVDPYSTAIPRMLAGLKVPRKGLIGPWGHNYPDGGTPGPAVEYLDHALRWWDHWLKGRDTGIMREPMLRVWMQGEAACCGMEETPGRWIAEEQWPPRNLQPQRRYLTAGGLARTRGEERARVLPPSQTVGVAGGHWCAFDMDTELPKDQRIDDARSLVFDSEPLKEAVEILGAPAVQLDLAVDKPVALLAVRLNEVGPDGRSRRVTYGVLNLTHRESHEFPSALEPGRRYRIPVKLKDIAHAFSPGNRIRVAISTSYWPMVLPSPEAVQLTLYCGASELVLPVRPRSALDARLSSWRPPTQKYELKMQALEQAPPDTKVFETDMATGKVTMRSSNPGGRTLLTEIGTVRSGGAEQRMDTLDHTPEGGTVTDARWASWGRGDWQPSVRTEMKLTLARTEYLLEARVEAKEAGKTVFTRAWNHRIRRALV